MGKAVSAKQDALCAVQRHFILDITFLQLRVAISGSGFSRDRFTGGNTVYFGKSVCTVLNNKTSDTLVSSITAAAA